MFLSKQSSKGDKVLYIGAADGYHINKLVEMFPDLTYDLWDPRKFDVKKHPNIKMFQKFFTDKDAESYVKDGSNILFISDIRHPEYFSLVRKKMSKKLDEIIGEDLDRQLKWIQTIKPKYSFLKFRLQYKPGKTQYLKGKVYLQPYSPFSTETRLMTNKYFDIMEYDNIEFDEKLAYFNCYIRSENHKKWMDVMKKYNIKNIWDNNIAFYTLYHYLDKVKGIKSEEETAKLFNEIIDFHKKKYGKKYDFVYEG
jgi:hypothetical protein